MPRHAAHVVAPHDAIDGSRVHAGAYGQFSAARGIKVP
jgi:hypothetical protein